MPSFVATPATLTITGAEAATIPARFTATHARLALVGGTATVGPSVSLTSTALDLGRLARLQRNFAIVEKEGRPDIAFQRHWQSAMEQIEASINAIGKQVADLSSIVQGIQAAQALAQSAKEDANAVSQVVGIANSYTDPVSVLTAANDGSVGIAAHTRVYGDGVSVSVDSGALSGFTGGDYVTVYYVDAAREGGAVTYQGTTSAVAQTGNTHVVGQVLIPQVGEPPVSGTSPSAPGYTPPSDGGTYDPNYVEP